MKMNRLQRSALSGLLGLILSFSCPAAARAGNAAGEIRMGGIEIVLEQSMLKDGRRVSPYPVELLPTQEQSYIITVRNLLSPAYIRVRTEYRAPFEADDSILRGVSEKWIKQGAYFYYTEPVGTGASVDLCTAVRVPDLQSADGTPFYISAEAEAVQAAGFQPDFSRKDPWGGAQPVSHKKLEGSVSEPAEKGFVVRFDGVKDGKVSKKDMFSGLGHILPGARVSDWFDLTNETSGPLVIRLRSENSASSPELAGKIRLTIQKDGKTIHSCPLYDATLENGVSLGTVPGKGTVRYTFSVEADAALPEEYQMKTVPVSWSIYSLKPSGGWGDTSSSGSGGGSGSSGGQAAADGRTARSQAYESPDPSLVYGISGGAWTLRNAEKHQWIYTMANGSQARDGWFFIHNPYAKDASGRNTWFYFGHDGIMDYGWIRTENGNWFFTHNISDGNLGALHRGLYREPEDGKVYYLNPVTGIMMSGWQDVNGHKCYFATLNDVPQQTWFLDTVLGQWLYRISGARPYGSMYVSERTPDGYYVDASGYWDGRRPAG